MAKGTSFPYWQRLGTCRCYKAVTSIACGQQTCILDCVDFPWCIYSSRIRSDQCDWAIRSIDESSLFFEYRKESGVEDEVTALASPTHGFIIGHVITSCVLCCWCWVLQWMSSSFSWFEPLLWCNGDLNRLTMPAVSASWLTSWRPWSYQRPLCHILVSNLFFRFLDMLDRVGHDLSSLNHWCILGHAWNQDNC